MTPGQLTAAAAAKSLQSCPTLCDPIDTRLPRPQDAQGKNTGVGCHFLLQCMKVKSESEVTQSCPTLSDPMDCSPPGSSVHGICQARVLEWGVIAFSVLKCQDPVNSGFQCFCYWEHQVLLWLRVGRQSHAVVAIWLYMNNQKQHGLMKLESCILDPTLFIVSLNKNSTTAIYAKWEDICLT